LYISRKVFSGARRVCVCVRVCVCACVSACGARTVPHVRNVRPC